jgi:hypothetical protein
MGSAGSQRTSSRAAIAEGDDHALACQGKKIRALIGVLQKAPMLKNYIVRGGHYARSTGGRDNSVRTFFNEKGEIFYSVKMLKLCRAG